MTTNDFQYHISEITLLLKFLFHLMLLHNASKMIHKKKELGEDQGAQTREKERLCEVRDKRAG